MTATTQKLFSRSWNLLTDLTAPLKWRLPKGARCEVATDLFAPEVKDETRDRALAVVALCPRFYFVMPTGNAEGMAAYISARLDSMEVYRAAISLLIQNRLNRTVGEATRFPLPNLIPALSAKTQAELDAGVPHLPRCPARWRVLVLTPGEKMDPRKWIGDRECFNCGKRHIDADAGPRPCPHCHAESDIYGVRSDIDWLILRGGSDPMHPRYVRSLREQARAAGVPVWLEWGEWVPHGQFSSFEQWVNKAASWIGGQGMSCFDLRGRQCQIGADMMRARDENAFPVAFYRRSRHSGHALDGEELCGVPEGMEVK